MMKRDSLIKGTMILALAALIVRVMGIAQRVPLKHMLGDTVMASFGIAYNIYGVLLIVATAGLPSAISKLVSERVETGKFGEMNAIFRASISFAMFSGLLLALILYFGAPFYAERIADDPESTLAIRALAPALLLFPMIAVLRGYFQGLRFMTAGGLSQIVEQVMRVVTAVILAWLLLDLGYGDGIAVAGASFGGVAGSIGAMAVMLYYYYRYRNNVALSGARTDRASGMTLLGTYKLLFAYALPITFSALAVPIIYFIDSSIAIPLLKGDLGYAAAKETLGILTTRAQSLAGIPIIMAIAVAQSTLPVISAAHARGDVLEVGKRASQAIWLSLMFGLFIILIIVVAARPANGFIFGDTKGTGMIMTLTVTSLLQIIMLTSSSIMSGLGRMKSSAIHVYIGIAIKLAAAYLLAPWLGVYGIIGSTFLCFAVISLLNFRVISVYMKLNVLGGRWFAFLGVAVFTLVAGLGSDMASKRLVASFAAPINYLLQTAIVVAMTSAAFIALLFLLRVIRAEEIEWLPARAKRLAARFWH